MSIADVLSESVDDIRSYSLERYPQEERAALSKLTTLMDCLRSYFDSDNPTTSPEIDEARQKLIDALQINVADAALAQSQLAYAVERERTSHP